MIKILTQLEHVCITENFKYISGLSAPLGLLVISRLKEKIYDYSQVGHNFVR